MFRKLLLTTTLLFVSLIAQAAPDYWIDVRSAEEFSEVHVEQAINIPHTELGQKIASITTDKNAEIWLNCKSGRRADMALKTLEALGYTKVKNVGGIEEALKLSQSKAAE